MADSVTSPSHLPESPRWASVLLKKAASSSYASTLGSIEQVLAEDDEEDMEKKWTTFYDPSTLQAMENSFFQVLNDDKGSPAAAHEHTLSVTKLIPPETMCSPNTRKAGEDHRKDHRIEAREEDEMSELFDRLFFYSGDGIDGVVPAAGPLVSTGRKKRSKRKPFVDLESLLLRCARTVAADNRNAPHEMLKQIREHASAVGEDGSQRCAYYFVNALEVRTMGIESKLSCLDSKTTSVMDIAKAGQVFSSSCPFRHLDFVIAKQNILNLARDTRMLHIIDFGILNGLRWVDLIQDLSTRPGGPPTLHITGIEHPQGGLSSEEMVENAGQHLAKYCQCYRVPFKYDGIVVDNWETIRIEDLKIDPNETTVVTCTSRLEKLLGAVVADMKSRRSNFLDLIRRMNPDIFIHTCVNGSFDNDTFYLRFREALYHYSAVFDALDNIFPSDCQWRPMIEKYLGKSIVNVVACEGFKRVERPQTYKQWHKEIAQAGFQKFTLDREGVMRAMRSILDGNYHKDFLIDNDGNWLLHGWKGRILFATSFWMSA